MGPSHAPQPVASPVPPAGATLLHDQLVQHTGLPIPVPNNPLLSGITFSVQDLVFGAATVDVSNAVSFTIN